MRIAVIGAGISGLGAAWLLAERHDVKLFERNGYFGGHSDTASVAERDRELAVDTGFIVYNAAAYPNLVALFDRLGVPTAETDMSFAVSLRDGGYEYSGNGTAGLFAQRRNVLNPRHWLMIRDILRFFREVSALDPATLDPDLSLGAWMAERGFGAAFARNHILPMGAAIWSTPANRVMDFPMAAFARFFANHGLLEPDLAKRPRWRTVRGGSRVYVARMMERLSPQARSSDPVAAISRRPDGVSVLTASGYSEDFDACVIATHADEALGLLTDADELEQRRLGAFGYSQNTAILHTDRAAMPKRKAAWASWNYIGGKDASRVSVSYWMNLLQPLETDTDYFVTLNPGMPIDPEKIVRERAYTHPVFDRAAMAAQRDLWDLQGRRNTWFAGSYFGYGFHEDGLQAGLAVAEDLGGVERPWKVEAPRGRILAQAAQHRDRRQLEAAE